VAIIFCTTKRKRRMKKSKLEKEIAKITRKRKEIFLVHSKSNRSECFGYCYGVDGSVTYVGSDLNTCLDWIYLLQAGEVKPHDETIDSTPDVEVEDLSESDDSTPDVEEQHE